MPIKRHEFISGAASVAFSPKKGFDFGAYLRMYAVSDVRADIDQIWQTFLTTAVDPFYTSNRLIVEAKFDAAKQQLTKPRTICEAWLLIAQLLASFNDAHVGMDFPDGALEDAVYRFPVLFALGRNNDLIVNLDRSGTIPPLSQILSINDMSSQRYVDLALRCLGAQNPTLHRIRIAHASPWISVAALGPRVDYDITWLTPHGKPVTSRIVASSRPPSSQHKLAYSFSMIDHGSIGYIDYRRCENYHAFEKFLMTTCNKLRNNSARALVIDIRNNFGGDSSLNDLLWTYVSDKPFAQSGPETVRSSSLLKQKYGKTRYTQDYGEPAWSAGDGTLVTIPMSLVEPRPVRNRYTGPVYLITSEATFSSGMMCAIAAKEYGLATLVGAQIAEPIDTTGEVFGFITRRLGLQVGIPTAIERGPKPTKRGVGVIPNVPIVAPADEASKVDYVLEKALELIRKCHA